MLSWLKLLPACVVISGCDVQLTVSNPKEPTEQHLSGLWQCPPNFVLAVHDNDVLAVAKYRRHHSRWLGRYSVEDDDNPLRVIVTFDQHKAPLDLAFTGSDLFEARNSDGEMIRCHRITDTEMAAFLSAK